MGSSPKATDMTIRYAAYLQTIHSNVLDHGATDSINLSVFDAFNACLDQSPYGTAAIVDVDAVLGDFHSGTFPSLADMYGKFMAGLDIEILWTQLYEECVYGPEVNNAATAQATYLLDEINSNIMPKVLAGYRDINSVMASAFIASKAIVLDTHTKAVNKFRSELALKMIDLTQDRWKVHLDWNKNVIAMYSEITKLYLTAKMDADTMSVDFQTKDKLWNLKLFEYVRAVMGAMQGAATTAGLNEPSQLSKSVSGALSGAAMGAQVGGGYGAAIGGALGLAASFT